MGLGRSTVATWLDAAGYDTAFFGKFLNGNETGREGAPPGWDRWVPSYYPWQDPALGTAAARWIDNRGDRPFFAALWLRNPHVPYEPHPRFVGTHQDETFPLPPSYDEEDVSDKPPSCAPRP